jgi:type IV pilus assembly protein PilF
MRNKDMTGTLPTSLRAIAALACVTVAGMTLAGCVGGGSGDTHQSASADAASINVQLGLDYLTQGDLQLANDKLQRALTQDPRSPNVHGALALLDGRLGEAKDADREYRRALALSHNDPIWLNDYAVFLCSHGRAAEGVHYADQAIANPLYQTPWEAQTNAGICLHNLHRDADALERFNRALQARPGFADAVYEAAGLEFSQEHYVQARLRIDVFLMSNGSTPDLLLLGWRIARAQGDAAGQQRYRARLVHDFPSSGQTRALELAADGSRPVD